MLTNDKKNNLPKLSKNERKIAKKHHKKSLNLLKEYGSGIQLSDDSTPDLFIGNGGLLCGMSRKDILSLFSKFGPISKLIMLPKKSFCFLSFKTVQSSREAFTALDGHVMHSTTGISSPLYLKFLKNPVDHIVFDGDVQYPVVGNPKAIQDLILQEEFITEEYEKELINYFEMKQVHNGDENLLKHRKVKHFGYEFLYGSNNIDRSKPLAEKIPEKCKALIDKMLERKLIEFIPDQLTVNQYEPGQGIPAHVDTHSAFEDGIISLSLNSQVTMEFVHPNGHITPVLLPRRSLLVMRGESRYLLSHRITPRKFDVVYQQDEGAESSDAVHLTVKERNRRISLTFRKILHKPCNCKYVTKCDSQLAEQKITKTELKLPHSSSEATCLEGEHVYKVYEEIADHFSGTRHSPWPKVKEFLCNLPAGSLVADVGCGNGKYLGVNPKLITLGSDRSLNLAKICVERNFEVTVADCLHTPYRTSSFDACLCIAVIHHLSTLQRRLQALEELVRITRVDGSILVYVWALEQNLNESVGTICELDGAGKNSTNENECCSNLNEECVSSSKPKECEDNSNDCHIEVSEGRNVFQQQDLLVPWHLKENQKTENKNTAGEKKENKVFHRFYHVFKQGEIEDLCSRVNNVSIERVYYDRGNWCVILKKLSI
ncbi:alkylated DNA repair protein alkB homolog 8-like [Hydractinia symbiolongicarpus]|uniref:alkylated DNA repair protein alkB homolog 8-like n=1 Tax=Hydractinia symbiolongicarpus TaxID=13093 RepID=UPI00254C7B28|nr:alkylated DNA repair protein alkB homolog 8-like [Hydractinia symbiolongicarpus]